MGGGILPMTIRKGKVYFLFAREYRCNDSKNGGNWSDFGGSREKNETYEQTAIREGWEETAGIFGNKKDIENLIKNKTVKKLTKNKYRTYVVLIEYDKNLPKKFRSDFLNAKRQTPKTVDEYNGLYEKDMLRWMSYNDIAKNMKIFRFWYKDIIKILLKEM